MTKWTWDSQYKRDKAAGVTRFQLRLTRKERGIIDERAKAAGLDLTKWIKRRCGLLS